jgi:hypothetical protein
VMTLVTTGDYLVMIRHWRPLWWHWWPLMMLRKVEILIVVYYWGGTKLVPDIFTYFSMKLCVAYY